MLLAYDEPFRVVGGHLHLSHQTHDALGGIIKNLSRLFGGCLSDEMPGTDEDNSDGNHKDDHRESENAQTQP